MRRCKSRHRKLWVLASGALYWCYECGAIRHKSEDRWTYPVGPDGENPAVTALTSQVEDTAMTDLRAIAEAATRDKYPRCKNCGATGVETNEWFGEGEMNGRHLCAGCFEAATRG